MAANIAELEASFCNPMKLKLAAELREELGFAGYSAAAIDQLIESR